MHRNVDYLDKFIGIAQKNLGMKWFAIADGAQHRSLPRALMTPGKNVKCLFDVATDSPLANYSPYFLELPSPSCDSESWRWITRNAALKPCLTVLASKADFHEIFLGLFNFLDTLLPSGDVMVLAFWDPAILGALVGQSDDKTLHVPGPILTPQQCARLCSNLSHWWYWGRFGALHEIEISLRDSELKFLELDQFQVDALVEASLPDQIIYHLERTHPLLICNDSPEFRYENVKGAVLLARTYGLRTMRDLIDFVCLKLNYADQIESDPTIASVLMRVRNKEWSLREAMQNLPS